MQQRKAGSSGQRVPLSEDDESARAESCILTAHLWRRILPEFKPRHPEPGLQDRQFFFESDE
jgi:hypothetical protein